MKKEDKQKAIVMRENGASVREISRTIKVSKGTVSLWVRDVKLTQVQKDKLNRSLDFDYDTVTKMFHDGLSYSVIAKNVGAKKASIRYWLNKNGFSRKRHQHECCEVCGRKNSNVMRKICSSCTTTIRRFSTKIKAVEYLGAKCSKCGVKFKMEQYAAYEFHHKDKDEKDFELGSFMVIKWEKIKPELDKCVLLCSNCHRIEHSKIYNEIFQKYILMAQ